MGQYTPTHASLAGGISSGWMNNELDAIAAAFNSLNSTNHPAASIPQTSLSNGKATYYATIYKESIAGAAVIGTIQSEIVIPVTCTLVSCKFICAAIAGGVGGEQADVYRKSTGASVLSAARNIVAADTVYGQTVTDTSFSANDVLQLRAVVPAGDTVTGLVACLEFKADHVS